MPPKVKKSRKPSWLRRTVGLCIKLAIVAIALLAFYGIYLDSQIRSRIDGKVWNLPAAVYGRMVNLEPGMSYSKKEMVDLLNGMQYRNVTKITRPGEYTVQNNNIEMLRRPFDFPDVKEEQISARLEFNNAGLSRIVNLDTGREFGFFRLDPKLITMLQAPNGEQRLFVAGKSFPYPMADMLIATEDRNFYSHDGISLFSIGRAVLANLSAGRTVQGGSTLTQQLVKNLFLTNERSLSRKLREAYMAVILDARYSKERILELYMNEVYLGQSGADQIRGFPLASLYFFGRPINELSVDQQAMLVGMVKGASLYNPWKNPDIVLERRNLVLRLAQQQNVIDQELYGVLSARPLGVQPRGGVITPQPAFMQLVHNELQEKLGDKVNDLSGVKIFTTLDPVSQNAAEKAVEEGVPALRAARNVKDLEAAMVIVDRFSGEVRAVVGGSQPQYAGFNRAVQARRSIGSLAKPPTYLTALSEPGNYCLNTWLKDEPLSVNIPGSKTWQPQNYDRQFRGRVMLVDALANSLNIPTVNLGLDLGLDKVRDMLQRLGVPDSSIQTVPAMLLGSTSLTPMEAAQMYQTIGSGGQRAKLSVLRSVLSEDNTVLFQSLPQAQRVVEPQAAYLTLYAMQQGVARGTSRSLAGKFGNYNLAAKTGTTNDLRDSWFVGIDGKEVSIAWVGRDNNGPAKLTGANGALTLYRRYLENQTPLALTLTPPEHISMMGTDSDGNFVCNGGDRRLPVWTDSPESLCLAPQQPVEQQQQQPQQQSESSVPDWVRDMFGG
ncbi:bifunctional glycosyl transferase/transpeptidase [Budviciaceae bacterium CWB-B4]|uniref:Penicillin-binding protein 1B n=1 Tax=Limnobaculum xujianqingii TaxID=2738837 RepID=A0A9D7AKY1_9GAMM|nr:bifunctional glycosyl transferase/transpeptidase [Limnobaculum xujianqingii]MBK5074500.1 bifunctional glycosyl transferase/transpeptidase [Limnobaculum xujianqingii]MBK5177834.1 bifunctional glycosyl transferase/transpeptidase [Limnobaculum xujianqingii]